MGPEFEYRLGHINSVEIGQKIISMVILPSSSDSRRALVSYCCKYLHKILGPLVQSFVNLMSSLRVISLTVLADSVYNILIFFAEKM